MLRIARWNEFIKRVDDSNGVICIGAGKRLYNMADMPVKEDFYNKITYIVDNNKTKQETVVELGERKFTVISAEKLKECNKENMVILITVIYGIFDIIEQLKALGIYEEAEIYSLSLMRALFSEDCAMQKEIPQSIRRSKNPLIPKKIHYCWFGGNPLPDKYKKWMESWKKYCPDYEIIEWNESNYDITKNKYMYDAYKAKKWGFVPDYARLDIIYNYGGIYLDTDVELVGSFDELLYEKAFAGFERDSYVAFGLGFGAQKGNSLIKELRDDYDGRKFVEENGTYVASPVIQTELLKKKGLVLNGEYQRLDNITIFPEKMFCGKSPETRRILLKPYTKSIHHYEGSWLGVDTKEKIVKLEKDYKELNW